MATVELAGEVRTATGKMAAKRLRRRRRIPGIVYGSAAGPVPVTVDPQALLAAVGDSENVLISLVLKGDGARTSLVILKELQLDPVKGGPLHADFLEVSMEKKIRVDVRIVLSGEPVGVKAKGGILEYSLRQVTVECLPQAIPERIAVDVSGLDVGNAVHVRDLTVAADVRVLDDGDRVVASVVSPAVEEAPVAEAEAPAEPEVVGKKEKEEAAEAEGKTEGKVEAKSK
ncbi:MAG: 50S ribosomal protein L25 [candidate division NC10 bacterium]|nr:50S ribosomal protein L25 [candidate division NC10 bacterium]